MVYEAGVGVRTTGLPFRCSANEAGPPSQTQGEGAPVVELRAQQHPWQGSCVSKRRKKKRADIRAHPTAIHRYIDI